MKLDITLVNEILIELESGDTDYDKLYFIYPRFADELKYKLREDRIEAIKLTMKKIADKKEKTQ